MARGGSSAPHPGVWSGVPAWERSGRAGTPGGARMRAALDLRRGKFGKFSYLGFPASFFFSFSYGGLPIFFHSLHETIKLAAQQISRDGSGIPLDPRRTPGRHPARRVLGLG